MGPCPERFARTQASFANRSNLPDGHVDGHVDSQVVGPKRSSAVTSNGGSAASGVHVIPSRRVSALMGSRPRRRAVAASRATVAPSTPVRGRPRCLAQADWSRSWTRRPVCDRPSRCVRRTSSPVARIAVRRLLGGRWMTAASRAVPRAGSRIGYRRRAVVRDRRPSRSCVRNLDADTGARVE